MSLLASSFQTVRRCTASLSAQTLARPSVQSRSGLFPLGLRHYSDAKPDNSTEEREDGSKPEEQKPAEALAELSQKLKAKEAEVVDLTGRLRYLQADFLNLQRNSAREKEQTRDFAITRFASDLLETVDVLAIALKSVPQSALSPSNSSPEHPVPSTSSASDSATPKKSSETYLQELHTGVDMTHRLLLQTLFKYHVKPFDPTGDRFDPNLHEALYQAPIPGKEPGTVIDCQKTGYKIKDRVLRAAQVGVVQESS